MRASFVLHLETDAMAGGEVRGDIEEVGSGRRVAVRSLDDIAAFLTGQPGPSDAGTAGPEGMAPR